MDFLITENTLCKTLLWEFCNIFNVLQINSILKITIWEYICSQNIKATTSGSHSLTPVTLSMFEYFWDPSRTVLNSLWVLKKNTSPCSYI